MIRRLCKIVYVLQKYILKYIWRKYDAFNLLHTMREQYDDKLESRLIGHVLIFVEGSNSFMG